MCVYHVYVYVCACICVYLYVSFVCVCMCAMPLQRPCNAPATPLYVYIYVYVCVCIIHICIAIRDVCACMSQYDVQCSTIWHHISPQAHPDWVPGSRPVNSTVPQPAHCQPQKSPFNRSEFELFSHHTSGATGDAHGDRLLEWASNPKFRADRIGYTKMRHMGKKAWIFLQG
jgi:hypothetical protein